MCEFNEKTFLWEQLEGNWRQPCGNEIIKLLKEIHKQPMKMLQTHKKCKKKHLAWWKRMQF